MRIPLPVCGSRHYYWLVVVFYPIPKLVTSVAESLFVTRRQDRRITEAPRTNPVTRIYYYYRPVSAKQSQRSTDSKPPLCSLYSFSYPPPKNQSTANGFSFIHNKNHLLPLLTFPYLPSKTHKFLTYPT